MLRPTKKLHGTGNIVVLDYDFCVLQGLADINKKGEYGVALNKNIWYWPRYIGGENIKSHFTEKYFGAVDALRDELEYLPLHVFTMKEENHVMMMMPTYRTNERVGEEKSGQLAGRG